MEITTVEHNGSAISYYKTGNGKPVLLIHGFGEDSRIFDEQVRHLASFCSLIVLDLPGSGQSAFNPHYKTMDDYAEAIKALLDKEGISELIVIGHSMGGYITLALVEKYPLLVSRYGLFHSSAFPDDEEKIETRKKAIGFMQEHGAAKFVEQSVPKLFSDVTKEKNPQLIQQVVERYRDFETRSLVQYYEAMILRPDRRHVLKNAAKPVLLILGKFDSAIPIEKGLELAQIPEICYIHICNSSGHMGMLEETDVCNKALEEFVR